MNTIVYLSRHSNKETNLNNINDEFLLDYDLNRPLSILGEENAYKASCFDELSNIDVIYSSNYARCIATSKYVADKNKLIINIDSRLKERLIGNGKLSPEFVHNQIIDENYKYENGESRLEVANRMKNILFDIVENNKGKRIYICTHSNALLCLFSKLGQAYLEENEYIIKICNKNIFDDFAGWGKHSPELFKLVFDEENKIINFQNINW